MAVTVSTTPSDAARPVLRVASAMRYTPGLDGLRGAALLAIFVTHADIGQAPGGFLAVDTFFTLSGFLITSLLLGEHARSGRVDLKAFWVRRAKRLLPASLVVIAAIAVATVAIGDVGQVRRIRGDAFGSLAYVANWRFIAAGDRYGARFEAESPLLHFWSLAIEEQFYVVFPLVMAGALALLRRHRAAVVGVLGGLLVASQLTSILLSRSATIDRLYFGTDVRASEMLVGALAAWIWMTRRDLVERTLWPVLRLAAPVLVVLMGFLIATAESTDRIWYRGGLATYAAVVCLVIFGILQPHTVVSRVFSWRPLVWVGVTSYGAYLVHWPIFVWLRSETSMSGTGRLVVGTTASLAVATLSYLLVEHPVRATPRLGRLVTLAAPAALVAVALLAASVVPARVSVADDLALDDRAGELDQRLKGAPFDPALPTVAMYGDSTSLSTALGIATRDDQPGAEVNAEQGWSNLGCSLLSPVTLRARGKVTTTPKVCVDFPAKWQAAAARRTPDVAVIQTGPWEMCDIEVDGEFTALGDPRVDDQVRQRLTDGVQALLEEVPHVAILTSPAIVPGAVDGRPPDEPLPEGDPARRLRFNEILREVAGDDPRITVVEWGDYLDGREDLTVLRPDGIHLSWQASTEVAGWLGAQLAPLAATSAPG